MKKVDKTDNNSEKKNKSGLERKLKTMTIVPVILMGIVVTILSYYVSMYTVEKEVNRNLHNMTEVVSLHMGDIASGEYSVEKNGNEYRLFRGDQPLDELSDYLYRLNSETGLDLTVFYYDIRMFSTITGINGESIAYTVANSAVSDAVINKDQEMFFNNIDINGTRYFACYLPLKDESGNNVGMIFAGKPTREVESDSLRSLFWIPLITILMIAIASGISLLPARELVNVIKKEKKFLDEIAKGNLNTEIDPSIVKRNDELGDMGRFSRSVQRYIREMIERDTLTRLYTRRIGDSKIKYVQHQLNEAGVKYCVCMGDIDFFKRVNDTYGHDAGDIVLRDVAHIFNENMLGHGFTVRWGGEELLTIFEDADMPKALKVLKDIREKVINHEMDYNGQIIKVTMTFGLTEGDSRPIEDIVKEADNLLYYGKQNGRNQIVTAEDIEKMANDSELAEIAEKQ